MGPFHHFGSLILISLGPYVNYGYFSEWVHVRFTDLIQQFATDSNECYDKLVRHYVHFGGATNHRTFFPEPPAKGVIHINTKAIGKMGVRFL